MSLTLMLAAALVPADRATLDRTVAAIYRPYGIETMQPPVWERPLFTAEVRRLIARWQQVMPRDEVDDLNGGDWLCLCQDWNPRAFRVTTLDRRAVRAGVAELKVRIDLGNGQQREARLVMAREGRAWRIADLFASDFPGGLQAALRETIAGHERSPR
jgi:hypothetical protein